MLRHSVTSNNQKPLLLIDLRVKESGTQGYHIWRIIAIEEGPPKRRSTQKCIVVNLGYTLELKNH